jgi:hypothetical protein
MENGVENSESFLVLHSQFSTFYSPPYRLMISRSGRTYMFRYATGPWSP